MNVKLPKGTHLYRVAIGPNGHSMLVKNKAFKPKMLKNARKTIAPPHLISYDNVYAITSVAINSRTNTKNMSKTRSCISMKR